MCAHVILERKFGGYRAMRDVAQEVSKEMQHGERYNIALLNSNREYRGAKYRYFFPLLQIARKLSMITKSLMP